MVSVVLALFPGPRNRENKGLISTVHWSAKYDLCSSEGGTDAAYLSTSLKIQDMGEYLYRSDLLSTFSNLLSTTNVMLFTTETFENHLEASPFLLQRPKW